MILCLAHPATDIGSAKEAIINGEVFVTVKSGVPGNGGRGVPYLQLYRKNGVWLAK
jgi:hypothetical protein